MNDTWRFVPVIVAATCVAACPLVDHPYYAPCDASTDCGDFVCDRAKGRCVRPGEETWTLVQRGDNHLFVEGPVQLDVPTAAGHLLVVAVERGGPIETVFDDAGNNYFRVPDAACEVDGPFGGEIWYAPDSIAGARTIDAEPASSGMVVWEVAGMETVAPVHTSAHLDLQPPTTTPVGPALVTTAERTFIVSIVICTDFIVNLASDSAFIIAPITNGNGFAHLADPLNNAGTYQALWQSAAEASTCSVSAAFLPAK